MRSPRTFRPASPNVVSETVGGESVILNLESGYYYGLNETGSWIWDALCGGVAEDHLAASLGRHHGLDLDAAAATVVAFADRLVEEHLLREVAPHQVPLQPSLSPLTSSAGFASPELTRYEDIQELLLIDPIHEVDEDGWPNRPEATTPHGD